MHVPRSAWRVHGSVPADMPFIHLMHTCMTHTQVTAFADMTHWPFMEETDANKVYDWFYVGVCKTGLPAVIVVCAGEGQGQGESEIQGEPLCG